MSYGIFLPGYKRPKSKKEVKTAVASGKNVILENTSIHGNNYDGSLDTAPDGEYSFYGPNPYLVHKFYGTIVKKGGKVTVR